MRYLVDTNIFNRIADGAINMAVIPPNSELIATFVQSREINDTVDLVRRSKLNITFKAIAPKVVNTESGVWGEVGWNEFKWGDGQLVKTLVAELDKKNNKRSNRRDALIAEVAIVHGYGLITADRALAEVLRKYEVEVICL
jgi:predicted nucleic acid-binding protein